MGYLDEILDFLNSQPWPVRSSFSITRNEMSLTIMRGVMQVIARDCTDGIVEVIYEHALHEVTRENVTPSVAARLILAILKRDRLERVAIPMI